MAKKNKEKIYTIIAIVIIALLMILLLMLSSGKDDKDRTQCPYQTKGNNNSDFVIQYIDSPYCTWCWFEEPILKRMVRDRGDLLKLEYYDIRYCSEIVNKHKISGTPSWIFNINNGEKEFLHVGFIGASMLDNIVCEATKGC